MRHESHNLALRLADELICEGKQSFTFEEAVVRAGRSPTATANLLRRMIEQGLIDRVRRGHYAIRQLGVLGTAAAAEDIALAVGAAFAGLEHRIAYRSALDEQDLIAHPARSIQVAAVRRVRTAKVSQRSLRVIVEPAKTIFVGARSLGTSRISDLERALLDAAARPELVGGAAVLAEALVAGGNRAEPERLHCYAKQLGSSAALRRLGSVADRLQIDGLTGCLEPILAPKGDIDLEPGATDTTAWRDPRWRVRWGQSPDELENVARQ